MFNISQLAGFLVPSPNPQAGGPPLSAVGEYVSLPSTCNDDLLYPEPVEASHGDESGQAVFSITFVSRTTSIETC
jgi:hypothetical protein